MIRPSVVDLLIGCLTEWHDIKGLSVLPVWFSDRLSVCAVIQVHHVGRQAKPPKVKKRQGAITVTVESGSEHQEWCISFTPVQVSFLCLCILEAHQRRTKDTTYSINLWDPGTAKKAHVTRHVL